jgi:type I restriction enzyme M protein
MGVLVDRRHRELTDEEVQKIGSTYHAWRGEGGKYQDIKGFCKSAKLDEIQGHGHILTPGRYVGAEDAEEDDEIFEEKMKKLTTELSAQMKQGRELDEKIRKNMQLIGFGL